MACLRPRQVYWTGEYTKEGKKKYSFLPTLSLDNELNSMYLNRQNVNPFNEVITVPCGTCRACRLLYAKEWSNRCMMERSLYPEGQCWFLTLTYDDDHVPVNVVDGNYVLTLRPKDLQDYLKRLRIQAHRDFGVDGVRFFGCGEYGDQTFRPHYHLIVFGLPLPDVVQVGKNEFGDAYYESPWISKIWPFGFTGVADCSAQSCAYVARYTLKKARGICKDDYTKLGLEPEFVRMSRRPGIGRQYFEKNAERMYSQDQVYLATDRGSLAIRPPKYFDRLYDLVDHERLEGIKRQRREVADSLMKLKVGDSSKDVYDLLKDEEVRLEKVTKSLKRRL